MAELGSGTGSATIVGVDPHTVASSSRCAPAPAILREIARYLRAVDTRSFRAKAYERGAASIDAVADLDRVVSEGRIEQLPGIGSGIARVVTEICETGSSELLERLRREVETLRSTVGSGGVSDLVVCESRVMRDLLDLAGRVARHGGPVLLSGEAGTGKEVLARAIHRMSPRSERSFIAINCAATPAQLLESELFGHVAGAMPGATAHHAGLFELAHEGTLFLDEVGALPAELQSRLVRVLDDARVCRTGGREARSVDVRVIAATSQPLDPAVAAGEFRSDLYQRLAAVRIHLPPLRERPEDIPALLAHFAGQAAHRLGHPVSVTPTALAALSHHTWSGNVRELREAVDRAAALAGDGPLDVKHFSGIGGNGTNGNGHRPLNGAPPAGLDLKSQVEAVERQAILRALEASGGNRRQAASLLGISLRTLFYKMRRLPVH